MNAVLASPMPVTRPKVHRLPAAVARKPEPVLPKKIFNSAPYVAGGLVVLGLLAAIPPQKHEQAMAEKVSKAAVVPKISVKPESQEAAAPETQKAQPEETKLAMVDARTAPVKALTPAGNDQMTDESQGKTIILQGKNEAIIGQMARIPAESEPITEIKSASDVDNSAGRDLLSIINKY